MKKVFVFGITLCLLAVSLWCGSLGDVNAGKSIGEPDVPSMADVADIYADRINKNDPPDIGIENGNDLFPGSILSEKDTVVLPDLSVSDDTDSPAENSESNEVLYTVTFFDYDGTVLSTESVKKGESATAPQEPTRDDYLFLGWDKSFTNIDSSLDVNAQYDNGKTPLLSFDNVSAEPGAESISIALSVRNNPGILGMVLTLSYDETVMTLENAENGGALSDVLTLTKAKVLNSGCRFVWDGEAVDESNTKDGETLILTFDILKTAANGKYDIAVSYEEGDIVDGNLEPISVSVKSGSITVSK